jgi:biopolymer transport protein ExbB/TolQ
MSAPHDNKSVEASPRSRRSGAMASAVLLGLPLAAGVLAFAWYGPLARTPYGRYFAHPVEHAEVVLFCLAVGLLAGKLWQYVRERGACRADVLPSWDGRPVPPVEASRLLAEFSQRPARLRSGTLGRRIHAVLDFVRRRRSAADLDDHLRSLSDQDALAQENSHGLLRFITWAIPILGFIGTVLGITEAIAGVTPEVLEQNLNQVTDGLATAFDTTALALVLTMVVMFLGFLVDRLEQGLLGTVDGEVEAQLAHRFHRENEASGEVATVLREGAGTLLDAAEKLVLQQVDLWSRAMTELQNGRQTDEQKFGNALTAALQTALTQSLETHSQRLLAMERQAVEQSAGLFQQVAAMASALRDASREQQESLVRVAESVGTQAETLAALQAGGAELARVQELLAQNLAALVRTETLEQAVHSLTAAAHLLAAKTPSDRPVLRVEARPPNAA